MDMCGSFGVTDRYLREANEELTQNWSTKVLLVSSWIHLSLLKQFVVHLNSWCTVICSQTLTVGHFGHVSPNKWWNSSIALFIVCGRSSHFSPVRSSHSAPQKTSSIHFSLSMNRQLLHYTLYLINSGLGQHRNEPLLCSVKLAFAHRRAKGTFLPIKS